MDKRLFDKFYFLFFPTDYDHIYKFLLELKDKNIFFLFKHFYNYIENYFINKLTNKPFNNDWKQFAKMVKLYHKFINYNLAFYSQNLKTTNLNQFIIDFIKNNFILKKNNIDITNNVNEWENADIIKPYRFFHEDLVLFEGYNLKSKGDLVKDHLPISQYIEKYLNNDTIYKLKINNKLDQLISKKLGIINKINIMKKFINENIKTNKPISFQEMIDLINEKNKLSKKISNEKKSLDQGFLFIMNKK